MENIQEIGEKKMNENERALRLMGIGDILDASVSVYKKNFKQLTTLVLLIYFPLVLITTVIYEIQMIPSMKLFSAAFDHALTSPQTASDLEAINRNSLNNLGASMLIMLISFVYALTVQLVMDGAIIRIAYDDVVFGRTVNTLEAVKAAFHKLPALIISKILYFLIWAGSYFAGYIAALILIIPLIIPVTIAAKPDPDSMLMSVLVVLILVIVFLSIAFFLIRFPVRSCFGKHAVILEKKDGADSISRSWRLSKKMICRTTLTMGLGMLLMSFAPLTAAALIALIGALLSHSTSVSTMIGYGALGLGYAFFYPFNMIVMTMLYINMKVKKEGFDLERKVDAMLETQKDGSYGV